jgi:hypothetical protein
LPDMQRFAVTATLRCTDDITLAATRTAISCSRLFVMSTLGRWRAASLVDDALLVADELVTDAVKTTGVMDIRPRWAELDHLNLITVRLFGLEASIRIEVWDSCPHRPALPDNADTAIKRGYYPTARGKVVWAELPAPPRRYPPHTPLFPPPEELPRHETDPDLLRRVRDGLEGLG